MHMKAKEEGGKGREGNGCDKVLICRHSPEFGEIHLDGDIQLHLGTVNADVMYSIKCQCYSETVDWFDFRQDTKLHVTD